MNYLTAHQMRALNAMSTLVPRALSPAERAVKALAQAIRLPVVAGEEMVRDQSIRRCLTVVTNTINNPARLKLALDATQSDFALQTLISGYPYLEFEGYIGSPELTGLMLAGYNNQSADWLTRSLEWLSTLHELVSCLPEGVDKYLGTPFTPYVSMHFVGVHEKRADCFGMSLPLTLQTRVNNLFGRGYSSHCKTVRIYGLHELTQEEMQRFGITHPYNPPGHTDPEVQYSNSVIFGSEIFSNQRFDTVQVVRFKTVKDEAPVWVGTYKFVAGVAKF